MTGWPILLAGAIAVPPLGRLLAGVQERHIGGRRVFVPIALMTSVTLWCWLALISGRPGAAGETWDIGLILLVLAAGFIWVEGFLLLGRGARLAAEEIYLSGEAPEEGLQAEAAGEGDLPATGEAYRQEEVAREENGLPPEAEALLARVVRLNQVRASAIMTPRERIVFVDEGEPATRALERMRESGRSRLPVVAGGSLDRILGIVHAKDLVPLLLDTGEPGPLRRHLRRWLRVHSEQTVARLLEEFRRDRTHVGVVGDTLGRTLGLVTLGDVFRYIAGTPGDATQGGDAAGRPPGDQGGDAAGIPPGDQGGDAAGIPPADSDGDGGTRPGGSSDPGVHP